MDSPFYVRLDLSLAYVILFAVLGMFTFFMHVPSADDARWSSYRKSRHTLGSAFFLMTAYCILRSLHPQYLDNYGDFWLLTVVSLMFSWLNYTAFLFLIKTEHTIRKHFIIDGVAPITLMFIVGLMGKFFSGDHTLLKFLLGAVFLGKSVRMFYVCDREWRQVNREQQDYYDTELDITWMRILVWMTFALSLCTLLAFYLPIIHTLYCYVAPLMFVYMTAKVVNYLPRKIVGMRSQAEEQKPQATPKPTIGLDTKIGAQVENWVQAKCYCNSDLTIKEVAAQMGTNRNYLSQYLNNTLDTTFQLWLNTLRIEEGKRMLATEKMTIEEVGKQVGFPESYNFSRWFKTITGTTPRRFREGL
jgi:AraC-like DNA-binding protein